MTLRLRARAVGAAAGLLHGGDLVEDEAVAAGEERAAVDDHVDLVGARGDGVRRVGELDLERRAAAREGRGDGGDGDEAVVGVAVRGAERLDRVRAPCRRRRRRRRRAGVVASAGSGFTALATSERTLPGVSAPSRVVRSMSAMILSSAHAFDDLNTQKAIGALAAEGITVDHVALIDPARVGPLVDGLGGITVDNKTTFVALTPDGRELRFDTGKLDLDGDRAKAYVEAATTREQLEKASEAVLAGIVHKVLGRRVSSGCRRSALCSPTLPRRI